MADDPRDALSRAIKARRRERGLSVSQAAKLSGISRPTWTSAEAGGTTIAEHQRAGVERVLLWAPGSIDAILTGGLPTELPEPEPTPTPAPEPTLEEALAHLASRNWTSRAAYRAAVRATVDAYTEPIDEGREQRPTA